MYTPNHFKNDYSEQVREFIKANGFGILISQTGGRLWGTHIPLELQRSENGEDILKGHLSKGNPQWKDFNDNDEILAIFQGPHSYISSSWYNHINVPTWNYIVAHVYGKIKIIEGEALIKSLKALVDKYEADSVHPVTVEGMPHQYLETQTKGIVGIEITISEIQSAYKLSQNRDAINHGNIIKELEKKGDDQSLKVAEAMKKSRG